MSPEQSGFLVNLQIDLLGGDAELFAQVDASLKDLEVCGIVFTHSSIDIIIAIFFIIVIISYHIIYYHIININIITIVISIVLSCALF